MPSTARSLLSRIARHRRLILIAIVVVAIALWATHPALLIALGESLMSYEQPEKADAALVLAGDASGGRILRGAELREQGFVPIVWVSGPAGMYGFTEDQLAIGFAERKGKPREWFHPAPSTANSTREEAEMLLPRLRDAGVRRLLLVTSDYHSRRAGHTFRDVAARVAPGMRIHTVAAIDPVFDFRNTWWKSRPARKLLFFEWTKMVADGLGI